MAVETPAASSVSASANRACINTCSVVSCIKPATRPYVRPNQRAASWAMTSAETTAATALGNRTTHSLWLWNKAIEAAIDQAVAGGLSVNGTPPILGTTKSPLASISLAGSANTTSWYVSTRPLPSPVSKSDAP